MAKFKFRLAKLLEYRRLEEKWAKDTYAECMARKVEAEAELEAMRAKRIDAFQAKPCALDERVSLDAYVTRLEDAERAAEAALAVLENDVETTQEAWMAAKIEVDAIQKLCDAEFAQWLLEENRKEQAELDEWSVLRRAA